MKLHGYDDRRWRCKEPMVPLRGMHANLLTWEFSGARIYYDGRRVTRRDLLESVVDITVVRRSNR